MQITLDRNLCSCRDHFCVSCFASHLVRNDFLKASCWLGSATPERPELIFKIHDRSQSVKTLVVKQENLLSALVSWMELWEQQAGPVI